MQAFKFLFLDDVEDHISTNKSYSISDHVKDAEPSTCLSSAVYLQLHSGSQQDEPSGGSKETIAQQISVNSPSTIANETEWFEEKSEISNKSNSAIQTDSNEVQNEYDFTNKSDNEKFNETPSISNTSRSSLIIDLNSPQQDTSVPTDISKCNASSDTSPKNGNVNIKKRVSEIMADANQISKGSDKSPRLQDFYTTTYDLVSPTISPESGKFFFIYLLSYRFF